MMLTKEELEKRLANVVTEFEKREEISAFYLFGSYAAGCPKPTSDVDLAILLSRADRETYLGEPPPLIFKDITNLNPNGLPVRKSLSTKDIDI